MKKTLYVLDAYGLIYRTYFAFINSPLTNREGRNVSALFGFFRNLHSFFSKYSPECFVAAFDSPTPTFRHEMYDQYKATRQKTPEELHAQIPVIEEVLNTLGVPLVRQDGFEADDIIASLAARCSAENRKCVILSSDKDLMQLVDDTVSMLKPGKHGGWELVTAEGIKEAWGIGPELMLEYLSLIGDASDNIPGVRGVGAKTAIKLLDKYGSLDGIYEHVEEIPGAMGKKVAEGRDMAYFSKKLITLCYDVPLDTSLDAYACKCLDKEAAGRIFIREGLPAIARLYTGDTSIDDSTQTEDSKPPVHTASHIAPVSSSEYVTPPLSSTALQTDLAQSEGTYTVCADPKELAQLIDAAEAQGFIAFDCETTGLNVLTTQLVGFSLSVAPETGVYIPLIGPDPLIGEELHPLMNRKIALAELTRLFSNKKTLLIMHNGKFDYEILKIQGVFDSFPNKRPPVSIFDTMVAAWLLNPDWSSFSLDSLSASQLGIKMIPYADAVPKGTTFADVPIPEAVSYAAEDSDITLRLYHEFLPQIEEFSLTNLLTNLEMPLMPILADMEIAGIRLEKTALEEFSLELGKDMDILEKDIFECVGHSFNIASPKQLQEVLFVERKLTPGKKTKTGYSTDTSVLQNLASEDILPGKILDYRGLAKLKSTYVDALPLLADTEGRIHTSFIQTGTATGRLSSRDPNLQNIPIRDENGRRIRKAFRPAEGFELVSADYAQIELVILAHLSRDENLVSAFQTGVDVHRKTASLIFSVENEAVTGDMRRIAKTINFGVMYGMSPFRLANELRIPRGQAAEFINMYF
ncbi:MAG TPA: DNA polymerase I, partial [Treponema sp.]|nr:DNA polymerase I [Treponema sp.]